MKIFRADVILALFLSAVLLSACVGGNRNSNARPVANASNSTAENANTAKTNVEELGVLVNVPYEAEDVVWKDDAAQKKVIAVLRFSPADANKIVAEAAQFGTPQNVSIAAVSWFPDELIAQSDMSGDSTLKGSAYPANNFFQEPYTNGKITRVEGSDYFVLELSAK